MTVITPAEDETTIGLINQLCSLREELSLLEGEAKHKARVEIGNVSQQLTKTVEDPNAAFWGLVRRVIQAPSFLKPLSLVALSHLLNFAS